MTKKKGKNIDDLGKSIGKYLPEDVNDAIASDFEKLKREVEIKKNIAQSEFDNTVNTVDLSSFLSFR